MCKVVVTSQCDRCDLGLQSTIKAPRPPSSSSLSALVERHRASSGMKKILWACKTENARVWLPDACQGAYVLLFIWVGWEDGDLTHQC